jgi:hypothetical protein
MPAFGDRGGNDGFQPVFWTQIADALGLDGATVSAPSPSVGHQFFHLSQDLTSTSRHSRISSTATNRRQSAPTPIPNRVLRLPGDALSPPHSLPASLNSAVRKRCSIPGLLQPLTASLPWILCSPSLPQRLQPRRRLLQVEASLHASTCVFDTTCIVHAISRSRTERPIPTTAMGCRLPN